MREKDSDWLTCANCGRAIRWSDSFCSACGRKIEIAKDASIKLPWLSETIKEETLWQRPNKTDAVCAESETSLLPKSNPTDGKKRPQSNVEFFDEHWNESWGEFYHDSPMRSICLLTSVLVELLMFFPYVALVLYVFQYNLCCAVLTISSAVVLLTHAVCLCKSYYSIFTPIDVDRIVERAEAMENTQKLLKLGAAFFSAFLLAFFVCLFCNAADLQSKSAAVYVPVSFDD